MEVPKPDFWIEETLLNDEGGVVVWTGSPGVFCEH
jgi:hypothetical protein